MFLASKAAEIAAENRIICTSTFIFACCWLLLTWFSSNVRSIHKMLPGGNITVITVLILIIGISVYLLH